MHIVCKDEYGNHLTQLTQWDQNITICIYGLGLSEKPEIQFANRNSETAFRLAGDLVTLDTSEDMVSTSIPNDLLWEDKQILVYVTTNESMDVNGNLEQRMQTIHIAQIPVRRRTKPADFYLESNVQGVDIVALKLLADNMYSDLTTIKDETIPELRKGISDAETNAKKYTDEEISELSKSVSETYATQSSLNTLDEKVDENIDKLNTLIGVDTEKSVRTIASEEVAKIINDNDETDIDTLEEITAWIEAHPDSVAALNKSISDNAEAIEALQIKDTQLATAITTAESNANSYTDTKINELHDESTGILAESKTYVNEELENYVAIDTIVNNCTTASANAPLSANQGVVLNNKITNQASQISTMSSTLTSNTSKINSLINRTVKTATITLSTLTVKTEVITDMLYISTAIPLTDYIDTESDKVISVIINDMETQPKGLLIPYFYNSHLYFMSNIYHSITNVEIIIAYI